MAITAEHLRRGYTVCTTEGHDCLSKPVDVDYDRLVLHVEGAIMADHERAFASSGFAPQELLLRSNPGLYSTDMEFGRDLTNPRDMYSILADKTKSTEDLTVKLKQELTHNVHYSGEFPKLSRTISMNEIRRTSNKTEHQTVKPFQNTSDMINAGKKFNVLLVTKTKQSNNDITKLRTHDQGKIGKFNLPTLPRNFVTQEHIQQKENHTRLELPVLRDCAFLGLDVPGEIKADIQEDKQKRKLTKCKESLSVSDSKLDKWFSEMPNEVFDKAQRALMEESIKDKLKVYQEKRIKKVELPNSIARYTVGPKLKRMPNTYLELRVDSFGKHLHAEGGEKMNRYKLQQKSLHQLKMRASEDVDKQDKRSRDDIMRSVSPRLRLPHRSFSNLTVLKRPVVTPPEKKKRDPVNLPTDKTLATVNMYDRFQFSNDKPLKRKLSNNYEEYVERAHILKTIPDFVHAYRNKLLEREKSDIHPNSPVSKLTEEDVACKAIDRDTTRAAILNIALGKEEPKRRNPFYLEKTLLKHDTTATDHTKCAKCDEMNEIKSASESDVSDIEESEEPAASSASPSKFIFTTIPTAKSSTKTSDSKSTVSSISLSKGVLKKFNRLEVFPDNMKQSDAVMTRRSYQGHKRRESDVRDSNQQSYKLDLKQYPLHPDNNPLKENVEVSSSEVHMQDVVFRFEPGEVFITNKKANTTASNRSSERARIIYGKVLQRQDSKLHQSRENTGHANSMRSVDGYRSDLVKFESRALADSVDSQFRLDDLSQRMVPEKDTGLTSVLSREDTIDDHKHCTTPADFFLRGKLMRNVAIETDVIGSQSSSPVQRMDLHPTSLHSATGTRPLSQTSDFVVDNNDGESLDSRSDDGTDI